MISSVATILVARLLGSDLYGLYGIVLIAPNLIAVFRDWGINSAIIRYSAQFRAEDRRSEVRSVLVSGMIFEIALGMLLSVICFGLAGFIASNIFQRPEITGLIELSSITILASGLVTASTASFIGMDRMELNSLVLVVQAVFKTIIMIGLVVIGLGVSGTVLGHTIAMIIAGLIGGLLVWSQYRSLPKSSYKLEIKAYLSVMLRYSTPLSISNIIGGFQTQFYTFLLPIFYITDNTAIGNFGIASTFVVLISFFATPIEKVLFPAFSKINSLTDKETMLNVFQSSVKYAALLVIPAAALVISLSGPAVSTLFGTAYSTAPFFLALLSLTYAYTAFGSLSTGNLLGSQGKTNYVLYQTLINVAFGLPLGYLLIMHLGVLGLILTSLLTAIPSTIIALYWMKKFFGLTIHYPSSVKILSTSALAGVLTYLLTTMLPFSNLIVLILGLLFFTFIFIGIALLTRTITKAELDGLRSMAGGVGVIGRIANRILNLIGKIIILLKL